MEFYTQCPTCGQGNTTRNGMCHLCLDCGSRWDNDHDGEEDED